MYTQCVIQFAFSVQNIRNGFLARTFLEYYDTSENTVPNIYILFNMQQISIDICWEVAFYTADIDDIKRDVLTWHYISLQVLILVAYLKGSTKCC